MKKITSSQFQKLRVIFRKNGVVLAYLFGSQARGSAGKSSDVDIAILLPLHLSKRTRFERRLLLARHCANVLKHEVDLVVFNDVSSIFFRYAILQEGTVIYYRREDERIDFESRLLGSYFDFQPFLLAYNKQYVKTHLQ